MPQLYGGSLGDMAHSLAREIEDALRDVRLEGGWRRRRRTRTRACSSSPSARCRRASEGERGRLQDPRRHPSGRRLSRHLEARHVSEFLDYPYAIDARGRSATTAEDDHVRDLILQVLFTNPGERVNRPEFGCGLKSPCSCRTARRSRRRPRRS